MSLTRKMIREAWISISSYKLRSFLTILGIIIGIASVVVMVSIGEGTKKEVEAELANLGTNLISIRPGSPRIRGVSSGNVHTLTYEDAQAIALMSTVKKVAYTKNTAAQAVYNENNYTALVYGVSEYYFEVMNLKSEKGLFFDQRDVRAGTPLVVIGNNIKKELFKDNDPLGKILRIRNIPFKIIAVLKEQGTSFGPSPDDAVIIPFGTFLKRISSSKFPKTVSQISINIKDEIYLDYSEGKIRELLRMRHKLKENQDDDFRIINLKELADARKNTIETFSVLLASIAAISLVVGSIGIMNMMLVSVTERTKEIGVRKAVGAKDKTILQQFLFEALLIAFMGSLIGLILGLIISQIAGFFIKMKLPISIFAIILSVLVSIVVGIASGLFPALKAAKLNPVDALRYE